MKYVCSFLTRQASYPFYRRVRETIDEDELEEFMEELRHRLLPPARVEEPKLEKSRKVIAYTVQETSTFYDYNNREMRFMEYELATDYLTKEEYRKRKRVVIALLASEGGISGIAKDLFIYAVGEKWPV